MYRFLARPKWIVFTLVVIGAIVLMVNLSLWQLRRLDDRRAFNDLVAERVAAAPITIADAAALSVDDQWRTVEVTGRYGGGEELVPAVNSYRVISSFVLDGGSVLLVERGTIPSTATAAPPPPSGDVALTGRVLRAPKVEIAGGGDGSSGMLVQQTASIPPDAATLGTRPLPDIDGEGSHLSYAVQWAIFAVCVAVGWVLAVRRSARTRLAAASGAEVPVRRSKHQAVPWRE